MQTSYIIDFINRRVSCHYVGTFKLYFRPHFCPVPVQTRHQDEDQMSNLGRQTNQTLTNKDERSYLALFRDTLLFNSPHTFFLISGGVYFCVRTLFVKRPEVTFRHGPFAVNRRLQGHHKLRPETFYLFLSKHERSILQLILSYCIFPSNGAWFLNLCSVCWYFFDYTFSLYVQGDEIISGTRGRRFLKRICNYQVMRKNMQTSKT